MHNQRFKKKGQGGGYVQGLEPVGKRKNSLQKKGSKRGETEPHEKGFLGPAEGKAEKHMAKVASPRSWEKLNPAKKMQDEVNRKPDLGGNAVQHIWGR